LDGGRGAQKIRLRRVEEYHGIFFVLKKEFYPHAHKYEAYFSEGNII
jgi:hypothetical protein